MQTRNKILDDVSQLMTNAMGVAQGAKDEADRVQMHVLHVRRCVKVPPREAMVDDAVVG